MQMSCLHQGSHPLQREASPRTQNWGAQVSPGPRCAPIWADLGKPQLSQTGPNYSSHVTMALQLQSKLKTICRELKASPRPELNTHFAIRRAETTRESRSTHVKKAKRMDNNDKFTQHRFACLFSVFPQQNVNSCELEPYLSLLLSRSLGPAE